MGGRGGEDGGEINVRDRDSDWRGSSREGGDGFREAITSREQSPERTLQEGKAQNHTIIALYNRLPVIPTEQVIITPCTYSPDRPIILNKLPEALVEGDWPAVKHASGISSKRRVSCLGN